jgi:hypothetical protein
MVIEVTNEEIEKFLESNENENTGGFQDGG